jgi:pimeloyl-ACP methyl ester carboxylesterase
MRETLQIQVDGTSLVADGWAGSAPPVVLLHAGVCDRRSWYGVAERLADVGRLLAYDRRGFGDSPPGGAPFRHVDDLVSVLDQWCGGEPAWLIGSSIGGQVALDAALTSPQRLAGLVLLAPAVSGAPEPEQVDPDTERLSDLIDAAYGRRDLAEVNRLEAWLWLDGPAGPEHRVSGAARELALEMNAIPLRNDVPEDAGGSGLDAWQHLDQIRTPVTMAWGDLDVPFLIDRCRQLAARLPHSRTHVLHGTAHLPYLEDPHIVAAMIGQALAGH